MAAVGFQLTISHAGITAAGLAEGRRLVTDVTRQTRNRADVLTPVDKGLLRAGNQMRVYESGDQVVGEVFNDVDYAAAVHDGSRAHDIRPRSKKALRFIVNGRVVFATVAHIPARPGRPWLRRALEEVAPGHGFTITS